MRKSRIANAIYFIRLHMPRPSKDNVRARAANWCTRRAQKKSKYTYYYNGYGHSGLVFWRPHSACLRLPEFVCVCNKLWTRAYPNRNHVHTYIQGECVWSVFCCLIVQIVYCLQNAQNVHVAPRNCQIIVCNMLCVCAYVAVCLELPPLSRTQWHTVRHYGHTAEENTPTKVGRQYWAACG